MRRVFCEDLIWSCVTFSQEKCRNTEMSHKQFSEEVDSVVQFWAGGMSTGHLLLVCFCSLITWVVKQSPHKKLGVAT